MHAEYISVVNSGSVGGACSATKCFVKSSGMWLGGDVDGSLFLAMVFSCVN